MWLALSFVFFCLMTMMKAMQYHILSGGQAAYPRVLSIVVVQNAVTNFIATGAGIASYLTMFRMDENVKVTKAAGTFVIAKIGDLIAVWCTLLVSSAILWGQIVTLRVITITMLAIVPLAIGILWIVIVLRQKFLTAIYTLANRTGLGRFSFVQRFLDALQFLAEQEGDMLVGLLRTAVICSLVYMALTMAWSFANLRAYSLAIPISTVIFVSSWMQFISWLPIQVFGGLGVMETSQIYLFSIFGVSVTQMATVSVGIRVILYLSNLFSLLYLPLYKLFQRKETSLVVKDQND